MTIHREGYPTILITIAVIFISNYLVIKFFNDNEVVILTSYVIYAALLLVILQFFRSPSRKIVEDNNNILSPADGKIVVIEEVEEKEYFKGKRLQVSIFMSPKNVHVNWNPVSGIVKYVKYHPGFHYVAWHPKASQENEMTTIVIETQQKVQVLVRQIAGFMARRIKYYVAEGNEVTQGKQLGFIKFGSRVDLLLPADIDLQVELGQTVRGNRTVIALLE
ncbi:MAG: phosphatidylserine decarboxylase family protein [Flavobacteriales bacterium]|nr:MAG: phosphatidylserine decarboxylase family protein [Flavobacteriales bacterium]